MRPDIRWQLLLALTGLALVLMLLSYQVQSASLCTVSVPASGGTFVEGVVGRPSTLNPLLSDPYPVDREIDNLIFDGLVRYDERGNVVPALAKEWIVSDDGLTITFTLYEDRVWHDGQPVTTADVAFTYGLMQDEAFPGSASLKTLWQSVTINVIDDTTISFTLSQPYSPFFEATTRSILPVHLLEGVDVAKLATHSFNQAPVGTGPFMVQSGQEWQTTGRLRLAPNPNYWREGAQLTDIEFRFFADEAQLIAAFRAGEIQAVNGLSPTQLPEVISEADSRIFTSIAPRYSALFFNLSESGSLALQSKDVRQGVAYALDRASLVDTVLQGQGVVFDGPYLPDHWAARPELMTAYTRQPEMAGSLLDAAGWVGAGTRIREGVPLVLRLVAIDRVEQRAVAEEIVRQLAAIGVEAQLEILPDVDTFRQTLSVRNFDLALVEIAPPNDPDLYDFWSQEAMIRGQNFGGWNNRRASEALETGRQLFSQAERAPYYEAFLRQFDSDLPALTLYQHVAIYMLNNKVNQVEIGRVWEPRDRYRTFPSWFLNFRDIAVGCPPDIAN
ncbi:MAG: peptide ABC transporter substrate-binding protein [Anaerolineales bacterium]|nr:peptide ABC transporter substrate-binding protein [Anaerolineales bacterium]MCB8934897.1 peptide ABC transporter substrate-binding protein [Promineifilum sp.]